LFIAAVADVLAGVGSLGAILGLAGELAKLGCLSGEGLVMDDVSSILAWSKMFI